MRLWLWLWLWLTRWLADKYVIGGLPLVILERKAERWPKSKFPPLQIEGFDNPTDKEKKNFNPPYSADYNVSEGRALVRTRVMAAKPWWRSNATPVIWTTATLVHLAAVPVLDMIDEWPDLLWLTWRHIWARQVMGDLAISCFNKALNQMLIFVDFWFFFFFFLSAPFVIFIDFAWSPLRPT